jgi:hypothetical protein
MDAASAFTVIEPANPLERRELEDFVARRFLEAYDARVTHFCQHLAGLRGAEGTLQGAAGYTAAGAQRLFLEHYLDAPAEALLSRASGRRVDRNWIAEVGNLAAAPGVVRSFIPALGAHLHQVGYRWVVFTATRELHNAFRRMGLEPLVLAQAHPARLPDAGAAWGRYYAHAPAVMGGLIAACLPRRLAA